jgi:hypothetical protein
VTGAYLDEQASLEGPRHLPQFGTASHQRWGSYQAEITRVEMLDRDDRCPPYFKTGDFFRLRLHYKAHQLIEQPAFGIAFYRRDGIHINGPNSYREGCLIPYIEGVGYIDYVVERLPLIQGEYELTTAIYNYDSTIPYDHQHRLHFLVVHAPSLWAEEGLVHVSGMWQHGPPMEISARHAESQ